MTKKFSFIFFTAIFFLAAGLLFAQNAQELRIGTSASGTLRSREDVWYSVRTTEAGLLAIETTGNVDTFLEIFDAQRNFIDEDDDGGDGVNARIELYSPAGRTYLIKLRGYGSGDTGPYQIRASTMSVSGSTELRFGASPQSRNLSSGDNHWYSVRTTGAGLVTVENSGSVDTYMHAYDSSYKQIGTDDDGGEDYNAKIEIFAEANQTYFFRVRGYGSDNTGTYRVWASFETIPADERNTERSRAAALRLGEATSVFIRTAGESRWYSYNMARTGTFVVQTRGSMDTVLYLYDSRGNMIIEDDDGGENLNALISQRLDSGTYYIEVKTYGDQTGRCTIHAEIR
ncbi:MAG: hypothetical protein LBI12_03080 [Treponema sp.]|jgi:hypothetical protein|nr:hypothetical protein [Treponema sp.]